MRKVVVNRSETLSPSVKGLVLACADGQPLPYIPGQWINLHVPYDGVSDKRSYSIASAPSQAHPEQFEVAVTRVEEGSISLALHALPEGAALSFDGPYGYFTREGMEQLPALFVGTGTGVGPLRAMIQAELERDAGPPLTLLFGCRTQADILYREQFDALAKQHERFTFAPTLSRAAAEWSGRRGYVQMHLPELVEKLGRPHVYVCGLSGMVNDVRAALKQQLGYDRKHIHTERYD
jgi:ferredoxin-NADP reductase